MNLNNYKKYFTADKLMGPNCLRLLNCLLEAYPQKLTPADLVLDLGCGTGLTTFFLCKETGARVYANDLWTSAEDNARRFAEYGVGDMIITSQEDAANLRFEKEYFNAIVSIDSYHYFAAFRGFFADKILPYIKSGGMALISIPGIKNEFDERTQELLEPWLGEEHNLFKSPRQWKDIIGINDDIEFVDIWEPDCFDETWKDWLSTENEFAQNDALYFESIIKPFTTFVCIAVRKK